MSIYIYIYIEREREREMVDDKMRKMSGNVAKPNTDNGFAMIFRLYL